MTSPNRSVTPEQRNIVPALLIGGFVIVVIVAAAIIAVVTSGGDDEASGNDVVAEQLAVTVTGAPLTPYSNEGPDLSIGQPAPTLLGSSFDGTPLSVIPGGSQQLVVFMAHWCPACNEEIPNLVQWEADGKVPEGLEVIGVSTGARENAANWPPSRWVSEKMEWPWPVMADSPENVAALAYGVSGYPTSVVLGTDGSVLGRVSGVLGEAAFDQFIADSLALDPQGGGDGDATTVPDGTEAPATTAG